MPKPPNLQNLLAQAQKMQEEMMAAQERLKDEKVEASAGGGMVKVVMSGDLELKSLTIDPDAVDPEDVEMLQDLVSAAVNEALRGAMELQSRAASAGTGGFDPQQALDMLGGMGGLGGLGGGPPQQRPPKRGREGSARPRSRARQGVAGSPPPATSAARHRTRQAARHRAAHGAAAGLPRPARGPGGRVRPRRRDPRGQGAHRAL